MNWKNMTTLFGVLLLGTGLVFALSGSAVQESTPLTRWTGDTAGDVTTEGGNITPVNLTSDSLTDRWAAFYGNVSGNIVLTDDAGYDASNFVYTWTADSAGGEVCVSTYDSIDMSDASDMDDATDIDTVWGFSGGADEAEDTFTTHTCDLTFSEVAITNTLNVTTDSNGGNAWNTCAINASGAAVTTTDDVIFCVAIDNANNAYNGDTADYQLMVPTNDSVGQTETYYFYSELN